MARKKEVGTGTRSQPPPTRAQQRILSAYEVTPSAAAVARRLELSERNVRRIVHRYRDELTERWRQRDAEQRARTDARTARLEAWLDERLNDAMEQLQQLLESQNESIRLRAAKVIVDLSLRRVERAAVGAHLTALTEATDAHVAALEALSIDITPRGTA